MEFSLDANKRYDDDPYQERYFIAQEGDEEFLLFIFSVVKVAYALDEAAFYDKIRLTMELRSNKLDSFSRIKNYPATIALNVAALLVFMSVMYILFPSLRKTVFGLFTRTPSPQANAPPAYTEVEMKELDTSSVNDAKSERSSANNNQSKKKSNKKK